jgi:uncharacterized protein
MWRTVSTVFLAIGILAASVQTSWSQDWERGEKAYEDGDYAVALHEFRPLAEQGDTHSQYRLGFMHLVGLGVIEDNAEALKWFRLAAEGGHPGA